MRLLFFVVFSMEITEIDEKLTKWEMSIDFPHQLMHYFSPSTVGGTI